MLLTLEEYKNNDIDEIENDTKYIVEYKDQRGNLFLFDVGTYHEINYDKNKPILVITLDKNIQIGKVRQLLKKQKPIMENYRANISAYKRQHRAIRSLHDDNYSSKNLKDILLNLDEPTYTPYLQNIKFSTNKLNSSQKEAIKKHFILIVLV